MSRASVSNFRAANLPGTDGEFHRHIGRAGEKTGLTPATVSKALIRLGQLGIMREHGTMPAMAMELAYTRKTPDANRDV